MMRNNNLKRREPLTDTQLLLTITICIFFAMYGLAMLVWGGGFLRFQQVFDMLNNNAALMFLVVWIASIVAYAISYLLTRALSRYRELSADRSGAYLTGKPSALASALTKITGDMGRIPSKDLRQVENMSAFFFATPAFSRDSLAGLMSSHPPVERRLEQLAKISADLGRPL